MVRIPSFARRPDEARATEDRNRDGRVDERDARDRPVADTGPVTVRDQVDDRGAHRAPGAATEAPGEAHAGSDRSGETTAERPAAAHRADADRQTSEQPVTDVDRTATDRPVAGRPTHPAPAGPRPRASLLATLGLVVGVASALMVLTGVLAGYGLALGVLGLLLSIAGVSATGKRHVAGKSDALLGIALSLGAVIFGALALTGALPWLTTETDKVEQVRQWLDTQFKDRF